MSDRKVYGELVPLGGGDNIPLLKPKLLIGRRPDCDITLRFPNVSSRHCELELVDGYWFVRDLGSSNGVKVNRVRCHEKCVYPGDLLGIGRHKYHLQYEATGERPVEEEADPFATSLMEKAGIEKPLRRPSRSEPEPDRVVSDTTEYDPEEDLAMQWLMDEA
ncbi:MAG: FHA domain-containing protein [Planctomycetota bacterium]